MGRKKKFIPRSTPKSIIERIRVNDFKCSQAKFATLLERGQSTISRWELPADHPDRTAPNCADVIRLRDLAKKRKIFIADKLWFEMMAEAA